jgi:hypothetical protein
VTITTSTPAADPSNIFDFAWIPPSFDAKLDELARKAQPERWDEPGYTGSGSLPVLGNYIRYTFRRLVEEDKVAYATDDHGKQVAAFNTGLFTTHYEPIFATFEANAKAEKQPWVLKEWSTPADYRMRPFSSVDVKAARYFSRPDDLIYDPDLELVSNLDHILVENLDRYPVDLQTNDHLRRLLLDSSIREAGKRAQMNWRTAVPQYYFGQGGVGQGHIQLLLPLCIKQPDRADLALVVEKIQNERYRAHTVLTLSMAYKNARLIARPYSDWLGSVGSTPAGLDLDSHPSTDSQQEPGVAK